MKTAGAQSPFIHLHTHSHYSLLDGLSKIDGLIEKALACNMPALAITDHGNLYGAIEFYKKAKKAGIKPIIGLEAYVAVRSRFDKQSGIDHRRYHLTLLARNLSGYKNLMKLVTASHLEGFYYKPRVDKELLRAHAEGLICLSGCMGGELARAIRNNDTERAEAVAREYEEIFGKGNYFLEIMHHPKVEGLPETRAAIIALAKKLDIPLVATQDAHYLESEDAKAHGVLIAIQTNTDIGDAAIFREEGEDFSFINSETAAEYFRDVPEAVANTVRIADMCDIDLQLGHWVFPKIEATDGKTLDEELRQLTFEGAERLSYTVTEEAGKRIAYELDIIKNKGYASYFLVVADLLRYAREKNILTNTRGSAAGSLVSYLTGITNVDPLAGKIPFERFLNPERPSAPDIDMDFADNRREEVIQYVREKYGEDRVAQIGTFGTMLAKGVVRDVARALGHPYAVGDRISRLIPLGSQGFPMSIARALETTPELQTMYESEPETRTIIDLGRKLERCARHISVHAAGVVIAPTPLSEFVPLQLDPKGGKIITQYDMHAVEDVGLLKFDFLGITSLSILGDSIRLVRALRGVDIDVNHIPLDDQKTFALLARGETAGLFQLNGAGMTRYLKDLQPNDINDINAMVALYRPGPMAFIPDYIERKRNPKLVQYLDPRLKEILESTYGILIYQDDILLIATQLAGYSWGEADRFRKAVGKKIPQEMAAQEKRFIDGCIKNNMKANVARQLWEMIETFAAYGFNKAHAASYGRVAYQTAYMKTNYPVEYMTSILTAESGDTEKIASAIAECKRMNIAVLPPDINESHGDFTIADNKGETETTGVVRFGLHSIKNLGTEIADAVIRERKTNGRFASFSDFLERIRHRNLNRKSLEAFIKCGALDNLGERGELLASIEEALMYNKEMHHQDGGQDSLFSLMNDTTTVPKFKLTAADCATPEEKLAWEKEYLGLFVSGHPLDKYRKALKRFKMSIGEVLRLKEGIIVIAAGVIKEARKILTRNGEPMLFLHMEDYSDTIEIVVFPRVLKEHAELFVVDKGVVIGGRLSERNGTKSIICNAAKALPAQKLTVASAQA